MAGAWWFVTRAASSPAADLTVTGVSVETYGAVGDGVTDDQAALATAFSKAPAGSTLLIPAGKTFKHSNNLNVTVAGLKIIGSGTIQATNYNNTAMQIRANNVTIDGSITFKFDTTGSPRLGNGWQSMIFLDHVSGTVIRGITVDGGPSMGILMYGASNYTIDTVTVMNTLADCIHNTNGSHDGTIMNVTLRRCGDDGVAIVSYVRDGVQVYNINVISPKLYDQVWGRAYTVVGGHDITFSNIYADGSHGSAIYVAAEGSYDTYGVNNVKYLGGTLVRSNASTTNDHGAILLFNSQPAQTITNVDIENMTIQDTRSTASPQIRLLGSGGGGISGIQMRNFTITNGPPDLFVTSTASSAYNTINWTLNGVLRPDHIGFPPFR